MKTFLLSAAAGLLAFVSPGFSARAADESFSILLDKNHTDGWAHVGMGDMEVRDGVASTVPPKGDKGGMYWYQTKTFADFTLKLEFKVDTDKSNSGILVRFPDPKGDYDVAADKGYEIDIYGSKTGTILAVPDRIRPTGPVTVRPGDWNEIEVTVIGQNYTVKLRGKVIMEYTGSRALSGYVGLQDWRGDGAVHFRNVRIEELSPAAESGIAAGAPAKADQTCIEILSEQAPNALEWAVAPLDRIPPPDIRENLTLLRENLLDEAAKKPAANAAAYKLGRELCDDLIDTLNERDKALVRAGYTAAQAQANIEVTNQALEARRRFTNWPTYHREKDQREELRKEKQNGAALVNQRPVVEWADRGAQIRRIVDALYAQYRQAARQPR